MFSLLQATHVFVQKKRPSRGNQARFQKVNNIPSFPTMENLYRLERKREFWLFLTLTISTAWVMILIVTPLSLVFQYVLHSDHFGVMSTLCFPALIMLVWVLVAGLIIVAGMICVKETMREKGYTEENLVESTAKMEESVLYYRQLAMESLYLPKKVLDRGYWAST